MNKDEMMDHLHKMLDLAQVTKQEMVNERHEPSDLPPVLWYVGQNGQDSTLLLNACPFHDHMPPEILGLKLVDEYAKNGKPVLITVGSEGYIDVADPDTKEMSVEIERGALVNDFMTNPASKIREAVFIAVCQDDTVGGTEMVQITAPFSYDDGLQLVWHERLVYADDDDNEVGGELSDVMRNAFMVSEEAWAEMVRDRLKVIALDYLHGALEWPTRDPGEWLSCSDEEVHEELAAIENDGLDVTEQIKAMFADLDPEFAEHVERADLVWDGEHSFGIGIKMTSPGFERDPPNPEDMLPRLIKMLRDSGVIGELDDVPVKHNIFHAMRTLSFREEIEETLGREDHDDPGTG